MPKSDKFRGSSVRNLEGRAIWRSKLFTAQRVLTEAAPRQVVFNEGDPAHQALGYREQSAIPRGLAFHPAEAPASAAVGAPLRFPWSSGSGRAEPSALRMIRILHGCPMRSRHAQPCT